MQVEVVSVEDDGHYSDANISGNCVKVTLKRNTASGVEYVSCGQIVLWEEDDLDGTFEEWVECAEAGEEGFAHWWELN